MKKLLIIGCLFGLSTLAGAAQETVVPKAGIEEDIAKSKKLALTAKKLPAIDWATLICAGTPEVCAAIEEKRAEKLGVLRSKPGLEGVKPVTKIDKNKKNE